jgi:hypothetical protein
MLHLLLSATLTALGPGVDAPPPAGKTAPETQGQRSEIEIEVGARINFRPEARVNGSFGAEPGDESWRVRQGTRLQTGLHYRWLHMVFQPQDVRDWGTQSTTLSTGPGLATHQAYIEFSSDDIDGRGGLGGFLRFGRQEVDLWHSRIFANSPWQPAGRAFDAARGRLEIGDVGVEAGAMMLGLPRTFEVDDGSGPVTYRSSGEQAYWAEATYAAHEAINLHVMTVSLMQAGSEADPERARAILMPAAYLHGEPLRRLTYQIEAYGQLGRDEPNPHRAWAGTVALNYSGAKGPKPGLRLAYEIASGNACSNDPADGGECETEVSREFEPFFGARHRWQGSADQLGFRNVKDVVVRGWLTPDPTVKLQADYHFFSLYDPAGAWRNTGQNLVGSGWAPDNTDPTLGHEMDFVVDYRPLPGVRMRPGYSLFLPTGAGRRIAGSEPQHFVYLWLIAELNTRWRPGA